jgi:alpha-glucosidase
LDDAEHIYGLGQDNANHGTLDRRGTVRDLWTGQQIRSGNVTANYPVPFYLSTGPDGRGYGIFVDNVWHLRFDLGKTQKNRLTWTSPDGPLDYYIITGRQCCRCTRLVIGRAAVFLTAFRTSRRPWTASRRMDCRWIFW